MNTGALWPTAEQAEARVLKIQAKLHRWATDDPDRRFADLFNLVCDPAVLLVAWRRVRGNKGARTAGVDGQTVYYIQQRRGEASFLAELRADLKARRFAPLPVRERLIPKPGSGKLRMLGIPTVAAWGPPVPSEPGFGLGPRHSSLPPSRRSAARCHPGAPSSGGRACPGLRGGPAGRVTLPVDWTDRTPASLGQRLAMEGLVELAYLVAALEYSPVAPPSGP